MLRFLVLALATLGTTASHLSAVRLGGVGRLVGQTQDSVLALLRSADSLRCTFDSGTSTFFDHSAKRVLPDRLPAPLIFDQIDHAARHARVVDSHGRSDVSVLDRMDGITFVEAAPLGVSIYTVFAVLANEGQFRALLSGHASAPQPVSQALFGTCRVAW